VNGPLRTARRPKTLPSCKRNRINISSAKTDLLARPAHHLCNLPPFLGFDYYGR
jgi:hypothetical protein